MRVDVRLAARLRRSEDAYNQVINGDDYYLQQEWSNADNGCVQYSAARCPLHGRERAARLPRRQGETTNTTYAIYWLPVIAPP